MGRAPPGRGPVYFLLRAVFSIAVLLLLFEGMITAFHLLNLPSNLAVVEGTCLLLMLAVGGFLAFRLTWKRR